VLSQNGKSQLCVFQVQQVGGSAADTLECPKRFHYDSKVGKTGSSTREC